VLDLKAIRPDPEPVRAALARRRDGSEARLDRALELDARRRVLLPEVEGLKARQNAASQAIAAA
jgi:seryl-tRNA synthetase